MTPSRAMRTMEAKSRSKSMVWRGSGDAETPRAVRLSWMLGGSPEAEDNSFGAVQDRWDEYCRSQIDACGCGTVGLDCPDGFEHEPFRCGAEVICGDCGAVMPRGPRWFGARDAPRFWSKLGSRCDHVGPRIVRQRQAAWQVYAELQRRGTAQGRHALSLQSAPADVAGEGSPPQTVHAVDLEDLPNEQLQQPQCGLG